MRFHIIVPALPVLAALACSSGGSMPAPDRVLAVDADGQILRQSTLDENIAAHLPYAAERVWPALMLAYADLGIEPTVADRSLGRFGNTGFAAPRRMGDRSISDYFRCGGGLGAPTVESGRVVASVVSNVMPDPAGGSTVVTRVSGVLHRNDGTSTRPINCASSGALEEQIRSMIEKRLKP